MIAADAKFRVIKVLHVLDTLDVGGTETQLVQVVRRFDLRGYDITVACLRGGGALIAPLQSAGVTVVDFPKHHKLFSLQGIYQLLRLAWFIRRRKFDVVHAHHLWSNLMAVVAARLAGARMVLSSQRNLAHLSWYTPFRRRVMRRIHLLATAVVANSEAAKRVLVEDFRIPPAHIKVLRNGVDLNKFAKACGHRRDLCLSFARETRLVVNVANMHSEVKGHRFLIEAAQVVCAAVPDVCFVCIGDGSLRPSLTEYARQLGLHGRIVFLGHRDDVPEILGSSFLFAFSSLAEGSPNAVMEAMAAGLPVVATKVGGIPELIKDGCTGLLVPPKNPQALAEAILRLLLDPELASKLAQAGQERAGAFFGFDHVVEELAQLYDLSRA